MAQRIHRSLLDAGYTITLTSPKGGRPPVDPMSELTENITGSNRRFRDDEQAKADFSQTTVLDQIKHTAFDAVFYPGEHGPISDLAYYEEIPSTIKQDDTLIEDISSLFLK